MRDLVFKRLFSSFLLLLSFASLALAEPGGTIWRINPDIGSPYLLQYNQSGNWNTANVLTPIDNVTLKAIPTTGFSAGATVHRQGFYSAGDGGAQDYSFSTSACSISAGAGNDFTQVKPDIGVGCWVAIPEPNGYDIRSAGLIAGDIGTNSAANSAAMTKVFAEPGGPKVIIPAGNTFRLACGTQFSATASVNFIGTGTLKFDTGCTFSGTVFNWDGKSGGGFDGVIIDVNSPTIPGVTYAIVGARAHTASITSFSFKNSRIINGTSRVLMVVGSANGGNTLSGFVVKDNYLQMASATSQNQCVALTTIGNAGIIESALIQGNTCIGSGIQLDGNNPKAINNDISGFEYGSGVYTAAPAALPYTSTNCFVSGNYVHDTGAGLDVNNTSHLGFEDHCRNTEATNNRFENLGGGGIVSFVSRGIYTNNFVRGVGKGYEAGDLTRAAFAVSKGASPDPSAGDDTTWINNVVQDDGSSDGGVPDTPAMKYGFFAASNIAGKMKGSGNKITISTKVDASGHLLATRFSGGAIGLDVDNKLIDFSWTQKASGTPVSNLVWAPLDTKAFKNFYLKCQKVYASAADIPRLQVSQDGGGTWLTSGTYAIAGRDVANGTSAAVLSTTATGIQVGNTTWVANQSIHGQFQIHCRDFDGTIARKLCAYFDATARRSTDNAHMQFYGSGFWNGDSNAIDGLRLNMVSANTFFGACTLTGEM